MPLGRAVTERFGWHRRIRTRPRPTIGRLAVAATSFGALVGRPISTRRALVPATPADAPQAASTVAVPLSPALAAWWRFARDGASTPPAAPGDRAVGAADPNRPPSRGLPRATARAGRSPMGNGTGPAGAGVRFSSRAVPLGRDPEVAAVGPILTTRETELAAENRRADSGPQAHGRTPDRPRPPTTLPPPASTARPAGAEASGPPPSGSAGAPGRPRPASPARSVSPVPGIDRLAASRRPAPRAGGRVGAPPPIGRAPGAGTGTRRAVSPLATGPAGATATLVRTPSAQLAAAARLTAAGHLATAPPGTHPETGPSDLPGTARLQSGGRLATLRALSAPATLRRTTNGTPGQAAVPASPPRPALAHAQLHRRATLARRAGQVAATYTRAVPVTAPPAPVAPLATTAPAPAPPRGQTAGGPSIPVSARAGIETPAPAEASRRPGHAGAAAGPTAANAGGAEERTGAARDGATSAGSLADWGTLARTAPRLGAGGPGRAAARRGALGQASAPLGSLTSFGTLLGPWAAHDGMTRIGARPTELASGSLLGASAVAPPLPGPGGPRLLRAVPGAPTRDWAATGDPGVAPGGPRGSLEAAWSPPGGRPAARRTSPAPAPARRAVVPMATSARPETPTWADPGITERGDRPPGHGTRGATPALRRERPTAARFLDALAARRPDPATILPNYLQPLAAAIAGPAPVTVRSGPASTAALAAVGKEAATIDRVIHLAAPPTRSQRQAEIVAHELVHAARPSATPRFFDDDHASGEEDLARRVGGLARSLVGTDGRTPKNPNLTWGTGRLPVSPRPSSGSAGTGPPAPRPGTGGEPFGGTGGVGTVLGTHRRSGAPTGGAPTGGDPGGVGAVLGAHRRSGTPTGGDPGGVGTDDPVGTRPRRPETPTPFRRPSSPVRANRTGGPVVDPDPTPPLVGTSGPPLPPETLEWIIDRIEQHVIDELERRGLRHNPGVF